MLRETLLVSFSGTELHKNLQDEQAELYKDYFLGGIKYNGDWLKEQEYYKNHYDVFQYEKYFGYFLWKPLIILNAFKYSNANYILYCDSNLRFTDINKFERLFENNIRSEGIFIPVCTQYGNSAWTKRDTFLYMNADEERYWKAPQVWTICMGFQRTDRTLELLDEYKHYCEIPEVITELPNVAGLNFPEFQAHRWEQSVMSILFEKYGYKGSSFIETNSCITKIYPTELEKYKQEVDKNPLGKRNAVS